MKILYLACYIRKLNTFQSVLSMKCSIVASHQAESRMYVNSAFLVTDVSKSHDLDRNDCRQLEESMKWINVKRSYFFNHLFKTLTLTAFGDNEISADASFLSREKEESSIIHNSHSVMSSTSKELNFLLPREETLPNVSLITIRLHDKLPTLT